MISTEFSSLAAHNSSQGRVLVASIKRSERSKKYSDRYSDTPGSSSGVYVSRKTVKLEMMTMCRLMIVF
jgi:hypothetical protein